MGVFTSFKEAIFGKDKDDKPAARPVPSPTVRPSAGAQQGTPAPRPAAQATPAPRAMSEVDVEQRLEGMAGADKLNWRSSIVDLMKLIGVDPSYDNRKELAQEMGRSDYEGSAEDNIWLHKRVMEELAKHGGKVPASLRD